MATDTRKRLGRYSAINLPKPLCDELDAIVKKEGIYGSRAKLVARIVISFIEGWRRDQVYKQKAEKKLGKRLY